MSTRHSKSNKPNTMNKDKFVDTIGKIKALI